MRPLFFFLLSAIPVLFLSPDAGAQISDSTLAEQFIALNASGKFSEARSMFAPPLQEQVSTEMLEGVWNGLVKKYGEYLAVSGMKRLSSDTFTIVLPEGDFDRAQITFSLAFGPSHGLYGFHITGIKQKSTPAPVPHTRSADTSIEVKGGKLYGTLLIPDAPEKVPVALIIAGSGPTDPNGNSGTLLRTDAYRMLADSLAVHGIASFRYDKRYVGESSDFNGTENDLRFDDYVNDAIALIHFLKEDQHFSGLVIIGHSEGALIGMLAAERTAVQAYISLSGMGEPFDKVIQWQIAQQPGATPAMEATVKRLLDSIRQDKTVRNIPEGLQALFRPSVQPYLASLMKYDPAREIKNCAYRY